MEKELNESFNKTLAKDYSNVSVILIYQHKHWNILNIKKIKWFKNLMKPDNIFKNGQQIT